MAFPGLGFGIFLGTHRLSLRIGEGPAEALLAAGRPLPAEEALRLGLVHATPENPQVEYEIWRAETLRLDPHVAAHLATSSARADPQADMAALIASAARPGLRDRIAAFAAAQKPNRKATSALSEGEVPQRKVQE